MRVPRSIKLAYAYREERREKREKRRGGRGRWKKGIPEKA
jgi:hypothetical protein